jgi:hypothetical protein
MLAILVLIFSIDFSKLSTKY